MHTRHRENLNAESNRNILQYSCTVKAVNPGAYEHMLMKLNDEKPSLCAYTLCPYCKEFKKLKSKKKAPLVVSIYKKSIKKKKLDSIKDKLKANREESARMENSDDFITLLKDFKPEEREKVLKNVKTLYKRRTKFLLNSVFPYIPLSTFSWEKLKLWEKDIYVSQVLIDPSRKQTASVNNQVIECLSKLHQQESQRVMKKNVQSNIK